MVFKLLFLIKILNYEYKFENWKISWWTGGIVNFLAVCNLNLLQSDVPQTKLVKTSWNLDNYLTTNVIFQLIAT